MTNTCPFCGARAFTLNDSSFRCGTQGPDENGEYDTGTECDKTVFRNAFLRCLGLLQEVRACGVSYTSAGRYHEVQIPLALWDEIRHEVDKQATSGE